MVLECCEKILIWEKREVGAENVNVWCMVVICSIAIFTKVILSEQLILFISIQAEKLNLHEVEASRTFNLNLLREYGERAD